MRHFPGIQHLSHTSFRFLQISFVRYNGSAAESGIGSALPDRGGRRIPSKVVIGGKGHRLPCEIAVSEKRILRCLSGVALLFVAIAGSAQQPEPGLPLGGVQDRAWSSSGRRRRGSRGGQSRPKVRSRLYCTGARSGSAQLFIVATLPPGAHTYSITQPPGGPLATRIKLLPSHEVPVIGKFRTVGSPKIEHDEDAFPGIVLESHSGTVKWIAAIQFAPEIGPKRSRSKARSTCNCAMPKGVAQPKDYPFVAALRANIQAVAPAAAPVTPIRLAPTPPAPPAAHPSAAESARARRRAGANHSARARHRAPAPVPRGCGLGQARRDFETPGQRLRAEKSTGCHSAIPRNLGELVGPRLRRGADSRKCSQARCRAWESPGEIFAGFLGGLILNVMPCVLPVIGLKILSFVEQAGHDRRRILVLNVWYSLGLISVFLVLAGLAIGLRNWAGDSSFSGRGSDIVMAAIVFAMGLSFLGVWEFPFPVSRPGQGG